MAQPTKKLINDADCCVDEAIEGLVAITPGVVKLAGHRVVVREDIEAVKASGKVTLLCGGGAGHEPAHAGYVGRGMLSGAVSGSVFASPPPSAILAAIRAVGRGNRAGTLLIVKNYTGDCINFGIAMERAAGEGILVDMVVVRDDCALVGQDLSDRRGLAGTVFIHKLAGAMAEDGMSLQQMKQVLEQASASLGTVGVCLYPCSVPGAGPSFSLGPREIGLGLGIHGEAGIKTLQLSSADEVIATMLDHMMSTSNNCRLDCKAEDRIALMINNLGGTSYIEMGIVARAAIAHLEKTGVRVERVYSGTFMTSLEMAGISLTLLLLDEGNHRLGWLDKETSAGGWPSACYRHGNIVLGKELQAKEPSSDSCKGSTQQIQVNKEEYQRLRLIVTAVCDQLIENEQLLNDLDTSSGDGDCGSTLRRGAQDMKSWFEKGEALSAGGLANQMSIIAEQSMGGSSGAFYGLFLLACQRCLGDKPGFPDWVDALERGMESIKKYGKAEVGDRTMLDPLDAALRILREGVEKARNPMESFTDAVKAAEEVAEATSKMAARAGRARYVDPDRLGRPDPGAVGVALWLRATHEALKQT